MGAPLGWTTALLVVGILGFAVGRYHGNAENPSPIEPTFPLAGPADPASPFQAPATAAPRHVPGTLRDIMQLRGDFTQSAALYMLAARTDREGIERLLEEARSIERGSDRRSATLILYGRYAELDPAAAIDHMLRRNDGLESDWLYTIFYSWARTDLDGALARAAKLDDRNRRTAGTAIVRARDDLPTVERQALASRLDVQIPVRDPSTTELRTPKAAERSWQNALAMSDRDARRNALFTVAHEWARQDPQAAIRAIESIRERGQREALLQVALQGWAQKDSREAAEWVLSRPPSHERFQLLVSTLGAFAVREPLAALAMVERLSPVDKQRLLAIVLMPWARRDPQAAAAWLKEQDDVQMRHTALAMLANIYAERDPDEALQWANTLSPASAQIVMSQLIQRIARDDPERAGSIARQMKEGPQRANAIATVAQTWAQWDPRAALAWAQMQSGSDTSPDLYHSIFGEWAAYDTEAAVSQLNFILDSGTRNAAILGILESTHQDSDLGDRLYRQVEGAEARRQAAVRLYIRLRETDPRAAEKYRIEAGMVEGSKDLIVN